MCFFKHTQFWHLDLKNYQTTHQTHTRIHNVPLRRAASRVDEILCLTCTDGDTGHIVPGDFVS